MGASCQAVGTDPYQLESIALRPKARDVVDVCRERGDEVRRHRQLPRPFAPGAMYQDVWPICSSGMEAKDIAACDTDLVNEA